MSVLPSLASRLAVALVVCVTCLGHAPSADAQTAYYSTESLLLSFFPDADRVTYAQVALSDADLALLEQRLGYRPDRTDWTVFIALTAGTVSGFAVVDDELGQHEPITFGVRMDPDAVIDRVEVVVYREPYGDEVRDERFRRQFVGRDWRQPLRVGHEIVAISGATISSHSLARGASRASAVLSVLLERHGPALAGI